MLKSFAHSNAIKCPQTRFFESMHAVQSDHCGLTLLSLTVKNIRRLPSNPKVSSILLLSYLFNKNCKITLQINWPYVPFYRSNDVFSPTLPALHPLPKFILQMFSPCFFHLGSRTLIHSRKFMPAV